MRWIGMGRLRHGWTLLAALACSAEPIGPPATPPRIVGLWATYWPDPHAIRLLATAEDADGPVAIHCGGLIHDSAYPLGVEGTGTDSLEVEISLVGRRRSLPKLVDVGCEAAEGGDVISDSLLLSVEGVPDEMPVFSNLIVDSASADGSRIAVKFAAHDDWRLAGYEVMYNTETLYTTGTIVAHRDELAPTLSDTVEVVLPGPGTYYVLLRIWDDGGRGQGVWSGAFVVP